VWVTRDGRPAKIAAFGINVHHRIAVHGLAFNLCPRLDHFARIVPCGLSGVAVTSVAELLSDRGASAARSVADDWPTPVNSAARLARALGERLGIAFGRETDPSELPTELLCKATSLE
jgi:lipoate-protein ligase B